jgi:two-component system CheB/CheR fusion protein
MNSNNDKPRNPKARVRQAPASAAAGPQAPSKPGGWSARARQAGTLPVPVPAPGFPVVGIGASAGGLEAFGAFFSGMPADVDPGMAFVLVQHLAPDHKSSLSDLIQRHTRMQVFEVKDGMRVQPNCAYIIPPGRDMALLNGCLQLLEPAAPHGHRLPIDFFFRSLAMDQHERAIGIILSGTGCDGTQGLRAIKAEGGMVMAQTCATCEFDGMPRSALATDLVDCELAPAEMPAQLIAYTSHVCAATAAISAPLVKTENALNKIFIVLRAHTGHDFSQYKPTTLQRRIARRMAIHQIEAIDDYVRFLQQTAVEVEALFHDLLIGVTRFFRDAEAFLVLQNEVIPKLFAGKPAGTPVRVWVPACSTGEEAYSIAILLAECMATLKQNCTVQIFATDIDSRAIATARAGLYPASIDADMAPARLARFFTAEPGDGGYRVHKALRDLLVFSEQNLIKDPPFSRLDLVSCRNLLIYLDGDLQKKLIPMFHYVLNRGGALFLGTSEGIGGFDSLFGVLDRKAKIYQRKADPHVQGHSALERFAPTAAAASATHPPATKAASGMNLPLRILEEAPLEPGLAHAAPRWAGQQADVDARIAALQLELRAKEEHIQSAREELDTSNEELKSTNEGMQAVNEELQSSNEELETAKEEMQSVNEELTTVNTELQVKLLSLSQANNDMNNLLAGTGIGTGFVDHQLRILRFTPAASTIINLIPGDVGRPVSHLASNLVDYNHLVADVQAVLDTLVHKEVQVHTKAGTCYTMRIQPYRTLENVVEGAVISFVDITAMVDAQEALRKANTLLRLAVVVRDAHDAITMQALDGSTLAWNPGAVRMYGWSEEEALRMNVHERIPQKLRAGALETLAKLCRAQVLKPYRTRRLAKDGRSVEVSIISTAMLNASGEMYAIATTEREMPKI